MFLVTSVGGTFFNLHFLFVLMCAQGLRRGHPSPGAFAHATGPWLRNMPHSVCVPEEGLQFSLESCYFTRDMESLGQAQTCPSSPWAAGHPQGTGPVLLCWGQTASPTMVWQVTSWSLGLVCR